MSVSINSVNPRQQSFGEDWSVSRLIPEALRNAAARLVDSLKVNSVSEQVRRGRRLIIKRRTVYSEPLAELANVISQRLHTDSLLGENRRLAA